MKKKLKSNSAITLIALVITIIVLLILAGVSLSLVAGGDGILGKAESAVDANKVATAKEEAELLIAEKKTEWYEKKYVKGESVGTFKDYLKTELGTGETTSSGNKVTVDESGNITIEDESGNIISTGTLDDNGKLTWTDKTTGETTPSEPEKLKVGDTVTYAPSGTYTEWTTAHSGYSTSYSLASGGLYTDSSTQTDMTITSWKVFKIDEQAGEVQLVPSSQTSNKVGLNDADGYNNGVKLLNDACSSLYSNTAKGITARSINIDDIESVMNEGGKEQAYNYTNKNAKYGEQYIEYTKVRMYPTIYEIEEKNVIDGIESKGTLGRSDSASDWISGTKIAGKSIKPYQMYYWLDYNTFNLILKKDCSKLLLPNGDETQYWLATRGIVLQDDSYCYFGINTVYSGKLLIKGMIGSTGYPNYGDCPLFPVVSLSSELIEGDAMSGWSVK